MYKSERGVHCAGAVRNALYIKVNAACIALSVVENALHIKANATCIALGLWEMRFK